MSENHEEEEERPTEDYVERNEDCTPEDLVETRDEELEDDVIEPEIEGSVFEPKNGKKTAKNGEATQFKNGNAGGPGRPPKPKTLKAMIRRWLFAAKDSDARAILNTLFEKAIAGDMTAIRLVLEHGKPDRGRD
jgi:hypothetical protein